MIIFRMGEQMTQKAKKRHRINLSDVNRLVNELAEPEEDHREDLMYVSLKFGTDNLTFY